MNVVGKGRDHLTSQEVDQDPEKKPSLFYTYYLLLWEKTSLSHYVPLAVWLKLQFFKFELKLSVLFMIGFLAFCLGRLIDELKIVKDCIYVAWLKF